MRTRFRYDQDSLGAECPVKSQNLQDKIPVTAPPGSLCAHRSKIRNDLSAPGPTTSLARRAGSANRLCHGEQAAPESADGEIWSRMD